MFLTSPSALPQARQCPRAGQRDFLKSTFCCCTEGEGCTKHFKRDLAPGEGRRVVSSGGAAYSEYYETLARECDGTCSTGLGMMGRTIGSDGCDRIAGKARHAPQPAACVCGVGVVCSWRPLNRLPSVTTLKAVLTKMLELRCRGGVFIISLVLFLQQSLPGF